MEHTKLIARLGVYRGRGEREKEGGREGEREGGESGRRGRECERLPTTEVTVD